MYKIIQILIMSLTSLFNVLLNPIYWIVLGLIWLQYKKTERLEIEILGVNKESTMKRVINSTLVGMIGGLIGSFVIITLGVSIDINDFKYILPIAILLMLIHPRFICFSYAGGIISTISLLFGYPRINVPSIMAIVAIFHLVESFLIFIDGDKSKIPIFIERRDMIVGGFSMTRFWPIPFLVLLISTELVTEGGVNMPNWWPLFKANVELGNVDNLSYVMLPVIAALGYGDMAIADYPENKTRKSAINLSIFSLILLILALISSYIHFFKYIAALFSPLAHEFLIQHGRLIEKKGIPVFIPTTRGVKILDVIPGSVGDKIGLKPGNIVLKINGYRVNNKEEINEILNIFPTYVSIDYYDKKGKLLSREFSDYRNGIRNLGLLVVPNGFSDIVVVKEVDGIGKRILKWLREKF